jgi:hypothetical protein
VQELTTTDLQSWQTNQQCLRSIYHDAEKLKDKRIREARLKAEERLNRESRHKERVEALNES